MVERKLRTDRRTAISCFFAATIFPAIGCASRRDGIGLSLEFYNKGLRPLTTRRFDFDGKRGPIPGYLGPSNTEGAMMSFMPGDTKGGIPQSVEVEWFLHSKEFSEWSNNTPSEIKYASTSDEIYKKLQATNAHHIQRVDLTSILNPELIEKIQADRLNTQLKMIIIFRDDKVGITAEPYKWR